MPRQANNTATPRSFTAQQAYRPGATTRSKVIKVLLVIGLLAILAGSIGVVRYTKHHLPPSTALLPVPTATLERQAAGEVKPGPHSNTPR